MNAASGGLFASNAQRRAQAQVVARAGAQAQMAMRMAQARVAWQDAAEDAMAAASDDVDRAAAAWHYASARRDADRAMKLLEDATLVYVRLRDAYAAWVRA